MKPCLFFSTRKFEHQPYNFIELICNEFDNQFTHMLNESTQQQVMRYINEMDFKSQKKAEMLYKVFIFSVAILSYLIAFAFQQFSICIYSTLAAMVLSYFVFVPGQLPFWKHPLPAFQKGKND